MTQVINIFQFNGCTKCYNDTLGLALNENLKEVKINRISDPSQWKGDHHDKAVITGYLLPKDQETIEKIAEHADQMVAFGSCSTSGGIYGLNYQKGIKITPMNEFYPNVTEIHGCLGETDSLAEILTDQPRSRTKNLCKTCNRSSTCDYLDEVHRQFDIYNEDSEKCFNDFGFMCAGYVAKECKERCIDYGTPCRACKPNVERSGFRMMSLFGSLMANVDVASEPTGKGGTDKLADDEDDITKGNPDNTGNFFRHTLAASKMPLGRIPSSENLESNIFIGRAIEELPVIAGSMGGTNVISLTLDIVEALEKGLKLEISNFVTDLRSQLRELEKKLINATQNNHSDEYKEVVTNIRSIAGNMNLSNIFFGGFKVPIKSSEEFDNYKYQVFEVQEGTFTSGSVSYQLDSNGLVTEFSWEELS